jgi:hypothetical protein
MEEDREGKSDEYELQEVEDLDDSREDEKAGRDEITADEAGKAEASEHAGGGESEGAEIAGTGEAPQELQEASAAVPGTFEGEELSSMLLDEEEGDVFKDPTISGEAGDNPQDVE